MSIAWEAMSPIAPLGETLYYPKTQKMRQDYV